MRLGAPPRGENIEDLRGWCEDLYEELKFHGTLDARIIIDSSTTDVSTSGTGEDTLETMSIPDSTHKRYKGLRFIAAGTKTGGNGNKTLKFHYGSTSVTFHAAANNTNDWYFEAVVLLEDYNAQRIAWGSTAATLRWNYDTASEDMTSEVTAKITGECAHADDTITQTMWLVECF